MKPAIGLALFILAPVLWGLIGDERWGWSNEAIFSLGLLLGGAVISLGLPRGFWKDLYRGLFGSNKA